MTTRQEPHARKSVRIPPDLMEIADEIWEDMSLDNFNAYVKWLIREHKKKRDRV